MSTDTDPAVEMARAVAEARLRRWGFDETLDPDEAASWIGREVASPNLVQDIAAVLAALTEVGRLLPPVVQTREEWGVVTDEYGELHTCDDGNVCTQWFPAVHRHVRTITTLAVQEGHPYSGATITHPWRVYNPEAG